MIHVHNKAGIANKLKNVVTALFDAHNSNDRVTLNFGDTTQDFHYDEIFTLEQFSDNGNADVSKTIETWHLLYPEEIRNRIFLKDVNKNFLVFHENVTYDFNNMIDLQYNNILDDVKEQILFYFNRIHFSKDILQEVSDYCLGNNVQELTGVHIRSWYDDPSRKANLHNMDIFMDVMHKRNGNFFVAVDSIEVLNQLKAEFGDRILYREINASDRHVIRSKTKQVYIDGIVDMLILSKCKDIIGTYQSTFTEVAWWFGGAKQEVEIPIPAYIQNRLNPT